MVILVFNFLISIDPIFLSLIAGLFTFFITLLGSSMVFFFRKIDKTIMDGMLAISGGIMLSASFFSLLEPAISIANKLHFITWFVVFCGFFIGCIFLYLGDKLFDFFAFKRNFSMRINLKRCIMLFFSITLHNIPEGLIIGVAYGMIKYEHTFSSLFAALTLTLGIAIQNFPEGSAISLPLRREGMSKKKAFLFGSLSAIVEPISAVVGAILVIKIQFLLPFIMSFTAGAMLFVTIKELIPESQNNRKKDLMALLSIIGFSIMMILELLLD